MSKATPDKSDIHERGAVNAPVEQNRQPSQATHDAWSEAAAAQSKRSSKPADSKSSTAIDCNTQSLYPGEGLNSAAGLQKLTAEVTTQQAADAQKQTADATTKQAVDAQKQTVDATTKQAVDAQKQTVDATTKQVPEAQQLAAEVATKPVPQHEGVGAFTKHEAGRLAHGVAAVISHLIHPLRFRRHVHHKDAQGDDGDTAGKTQTPDHKSQPGDATQPAKDAVKPGDPTQPAKDAVLPGDSTRPPQDTTGDGKKSQPVDIFADLPGMSDNPEVIKQREQINAQAKEKIFGATEDAYKQQLLADKRLHLSPEEAARRAHDEAQMDWNQFRLNEAQFEHRSQQLKDVLRHEGVKPESAVESQANKEITDTYKSISDLLRANDNPKIPGIHEAERAHIAEQILSHAAVPTSIDQGSYNTCNVTTIEARTYTRHPSIAAQLVVDVATTGETVTKGGTHVQIDSGSIAPHGQSNEYPTVDGHRVLASQIFEVTAVNAYLKRHSPSFRYTQVEPDPRGTPLEDPSKMHVDDKGRSHLLFSHKADNGERMRNTITGQEIKIAGTQNLDRTPGAVLVAEPYGIYDVGNDISGKQEKGWLISHGKYTHADVAVQSLDQMNDALAKAKEQGKLPVVVVVYTDNPPFSVDSGGAKGGHVVTVTDYQPGNPPKVSVDNQWGSHADHLGDNAMPVRQLYEATRWGSDVNNKHEKMSDVAHEIQDFRQKGLNTDCDELELLHRQRENGLQPSDSAYIDQVMNKLRDIKTHFPEHAQDANYVKGIAQWMGAIDADLPPAQQLVLHSMVQQMGRLV